MVSTRSRAPASATRVFSEGDLLLQRAHIVSSLLLRGVQLRPQRPRGFARERASTFSASSRARSRVSAVSLQLEDGEPIGLQQVERRAREALLPIMTGIMTGGGETCRERGESRTREHDGAEGARSSDDDDENELLAAAPVMDDAKPSVAATTTIKIVASISRGRAEMRARARSSAAWRVAYLAIASQRALARGPSTTSTRGRVCGKPIVTKA